MSAPMPATGPWDAVIRAASPTPAFERLLRASSFRESGWRLDARNPESTATGLFQTTQPALDSFNRATGKAYTRDDLAADAAKATEVARWHYLTIARRLARAGLTPDFSEEEFLLYVEASYVLGDSLVPKAVAALRDCNCPVDIRSVLSQALLLKPAAAAWLTPPNVAHVARVVADARGAASPALAKLERLDAADAAVGLDFYGPSRVRDTLRQTDDYMRQLDAATGKLTAEQRADAGAALDQWAALKRRWDDFYRRVGDSWWESLWGSNVTLAQDIASQARALAARLPGDASRYSPPPGAEPSSGPSLGAGLALAGAAVVTVAVVARARP